jgi:hypothetical protein
MKSCAWEVLNIDLFFSGLGSLAAEKFKGKDEGHILNIKYSTPNFNI